MLLYRSFPVSLNFQKIWLTELCFHFVSIYSFKIWHLLSDIFFSFLNSFILSLLPQPPLSNFLLSVSFSILIPLLAALQHCRAPTKRGGSFKSSQDSRLSILFICIWEPLHSSIDGMAKAPSESAALLKLYHCPVTESLLSF